MNRLNEFMLKRETKRKRNKSFHEYFGEKKKKDTLIWIYLFITGLFSPPKNQIHYLLFIKFPIKANVILSISDKYKWRFSQHTL
ncbi:hypothetical protein DERP_012054 [Dermatophagoides pteronyssinus]|uniref:Uncharacterized protein n=1 Tax=Dermatophagoides pteronyssinus TaxID=6956 RepID=A0ABQ8ITT0_DERPT|nr:hypothetical protein DERP_012054 [Dermatophagoides pteronyssinus]